MNKVTKMMMMSNKANRKGQMDYNRQRGNYGREMEYDSADYGRESMRDGRRMSRNRDYDRYGGNYDTSSRGRDSRERREEYPSGYMSGYNYDRREMPRERRENREGRSYEDWDDIDEDDRHKAKLNDYNPREWAKEMQNADGSSGAHWSMEDTETVRKTRNINDCKPEDFWIAMNMMYSDYQGVAKKYGIDKPEFYADMARGFLTDKDSKQGREKLEAYYGYVVK